MDILWSRLTFIVGCGAVVGIVASLIFVVAHRVFKPTLVDEDALTSGAAETEENPNRWSGKAKSAPALMDVLKQAKAAVLEHKATPPGLVDKSEPAISLSSAVTAPPVLIPKAEPAPIGIDNIEGKRDVIGLALEKFFRTTSIDEKAMLVRDSQRVKPLMVSYYSRAPMPVYKWRGLGRMVRVDEPGYRFGFVQALFEDTTPASVVIEETADGRYLVDWEGLVRYGELSWADFLRIKPLEPKLLRVIASRVEESPSVAALAPATSQWLELRHPAEAGTVLGYFDRDDPKYSRLVQQLEQGNWKDVPVTLRLCFPSTPTKLEGMGVRIAGVEGKGWLILN
jgi:hypothetical protein